MAEGGQSRGPSDESRGVRLDEGDQGENRR